MYLKAGRHFCVMEDPGGEGLGLFFANVAEQENQTPGPL